MDRMRGGKTEMAKVIVTFPKADCKFLAAACFVSDEVPVTAFILRDTIIRPICTNTK
jgi:hypothetical protein